MIIQFSQVFCGNVNHTTGMGISSRTNNSDCSPGLKGNLLYDLDRLDCMKIKAIIQLLLTLFVLLLAAGCRPGTGTDTSYGHPNGAVNSPDTTGDPRTNQNNCSYLNSGRCPDPPGRICC